VNWCLFSFLYLSDSLDPNDAHSHITSNWLEPVYQDIILTQMDITTDGFGFMLSVGDLTWVPFTYSLQLVYLSFVPLHLSNLELALVLAVQLVGYGIFRISNEEKNAFRRRSENPKGRSIFFFYIWVS
jgi:hypothetical protein